jgi:hypothetical protein
LKLTVNKSSANFNAVRWLTNAIYKGKDDKERLKMVAVINGCGYATDGRRMHVVEDVGIENGAYKVLKDTKQEIVFETCTLATPNYPAVIPKPDVLSEPLKVQAYVSGESGNKYAALAALARGSPAEYVFAIDDLLGALDITKFGNDEFEFQWTTRERRNVLVVKYTVLGLARKAVIAELTS